MPAYLPLGLLFVGGVILTAGDLVMKKWVVSNSLYTFIFGIFIYMLGMLFLAYSFKYENIAVASTIFVIFNVITLSIFSWLYFKETLTPFQIIGIIIGLVSVIFLELGG